MFVFIHSFTMRTRRKKKLWKLYESELKHKGENYAMGYCNIWTIGCDNKTAHTHTHHAHWFIFTSVLSIDLVGLVVNGVSMITWKFPECVHRPLRVTWSMSIRVCMQAKKKEKKTNHIGGFRIWWCNLEIIRMRKRNNHEFEKSFGRNTLHSKMNHLNRLAPI